MDESLYGRLLNAGGELIAEGPCRLDEEAGTATLEPERELGVIQRERGVLVLELSSGRSLRVSDQPIIFRLGSTDGSGQNTRRTKYRLRLISDPELVKFTQDATAAGATGEGAPTPERETPAAR